MLFYINVANCYNHDSLKVGSTLDTLSIPKVSDLLACMYFVLSPFLIYTNYSKWITKKYILILP